MIKQKVELLEAATYLYPLASLDLFRCPTMGTASLLISCIYLDIYHFAHTVRQYFHSYYKIIIIISLMTLA